MQSTRRNTRNMFIKISFAIWIFSAFMQLTQTSKVSENEVDALPTPCTCGIFLSGQFKKGSKEQPKGNAALQQELDKSYSNSALGIRQCTNKCLETIVKHLPNSSNIICGAIDRDCHKEKAYLFVKNASPKWHNSNLSAGREYCCKDNKPYKCPL